MSSIAAADPLPFESALPDIAWPAPVSGPGMAVLSLLYQLERCERWPAGRLRDFQRRQLARLAAHAAAHVPFYRPQAAALQALVAAADDPAAFRAGWRALPLLDRATVQQAGDLLVSEALPDGHGAVAESFTAGSTGRPVRVLRSELAQLYWNAVTVRDHLWHGRDLGGTLAVIRSSAPGHAPWPDGETLAAWGPATASAFRTGPAVGLNILTSTEQQLDWLLRRRPDYLLTHPTVLDRLLRLSVAGGRRPAGLRQVLTISESLPPGLRDLCRAAWQAPIVDTYSSREVGYLALQCPQAEHYHVQAETVLVEVLDGDGRPCPPGDVGRVVATPLHNLAQPLLRYVLEDHAEVGPIEGGQACACGRGLPVLRRILGRTQNMLRLPGGGTRWPLLSSDDIGRLLALAPIRAWRFVQTALDRLEVHLETARPLTAAETAAVVGWARGKFGAPLAIDLVFPPAIGRSAGGKFEDFVCRVSAAAG